RLGSCPPGRLPGGRATGSEGDCARPGGPPEPGGLDRGRAGRVLERAGGAHQAARPGGAGHRPTVVKRLIVTGDDFGVSPEVNAGIRRAHVEGILTSASLMVNEAAAPEAAALAREPPTLARRPHLALSDS